MSRAPDPGTDYPIRSSSAPRRMLEEIREWLSCSGHLLDQWIRRYRWLLRPLAFREYRKWIATMNEEPPAGRPIAAFDFRNTRIDGPGGRRFYGLFIFFVRAGYYPVIQQHYLFLANFKRTLKRHCFNEGFSVREAKQPLPSPYVLITDRNTSPLREKALKTLLIDYRGEAAPKDAFSLPFPMFPAIYALGDDTRLDEFRARARHWGVFFGGAAAADHYKKDSISRIYGKTPRGPLIKALMEGLPEQEQLWLSGQAHFDACLHRPFPGLVVSETAMLSIPADRWLEAIANARFYLAAPGYRYPMSHNIIEAMAVGTPPITEYPELFDPPLVDGVNCLVYRGAAGAIAAIEGAKTIDSQRYRALSDAAAAYYDTHLHPEAVVRGMLEGEQALRRVNLLPFLRNRGGFA